MGQVFSVKPTQALTPNQSNCWMGRGWALWSTYGVPVIYCTHSYVVLHFVCTTAFSVQNRDKRHTSRALAS